MASNLPPGCTSPDGGIDHAFEAASESLLELCQSPEEVRVLCAIAPPILDALRDAYREGFEAGQEAGLYQGRLEERE